MWRRCNRTNVRSFGGSTPETQRGAQKETKSTAGTQKTPHFLNFALIFFRRGCVSMVRNLVVFCHTLEPDGVVN